MRRIERLDRERELRRLGIPIGGPRLLHLLVLVFAVPTVAASFFLWQASARSLAAMPVAVLAVVAASVAVMALRRLQPLPCPAWTYVLCGAGIAILALVPVDAVLSEGLAAYRAGLPFDLLGAANLSAQRLGRMTAGTALPALGGVALLLLGLVDLRLKTRFF